MECGITYCLSRTRTSFELVAFVLNLSVLVRMSLSDLRLFDETLIITFVQRGSDVFSVGPTHVQALSLTPSLCDLTLLTADTAVCLVVGESAQSAKAGRFGESLNAAGPRLTATSWHMAKDTWISAYYWIVFVLSVPNHECRNRPNFEVFRYKRCMG